jgi:GcrA cell cycle regulator
MSWTDERVERLKVLWADGRSASQIAAELGEVTRNAVIGKVHRLGLSGRAKTSVPARPRKERRPGPRSARHATIGATALKALRHLDPDPEPDPEPAFLEEPDPAFRATILTLTEHTCRWPLGDPGGPDFFFCGRASDPGVPYCPYHTRIAYQPVGDRRRDRRRA